MKLDPNAGLCASCVHVRPVVSARGPLYLRCVRSAEDPRFPKYPPLPVRTCPGYQPTPGGAPPTRG